MCKDYDWRESFFTARHLFRAIERQPDCFECRAIAESPEREGNLVRKKMWEIFQRIYGPEQTRPPQQAAVGVDNNNNITTTGMVVDDVAYRQGMPFTKGNESRRKLIIRCGYRPIALPLPVYNMLSPFLPDLEQEWL